MEQTEKRTVRVRLREELFRKFKVYCAINDISLTDQVNKIVYKFIEEQSEEIKIINTKK